ncbi:MAG: hypothetical protein RL514_1048 [Verrucomicrobiota bacterium]
MLWDNGATWGSGGGHEFTALDVWLLRLGVRVSHGRAYHPQTQGMEERFHRTIEAEVLIDCSHMQQAFDGWRPIYNTQRPPAALALATRAKPLPA